MLMITASSCGKEDSLILNFLNIVMQTKRICLWSSPRNISTAMMYSFAQRPDTIVFDEPLYAHYLRVTGIDHPGKEEVIASQEQDGEKVVEQIILGECGNINTIIKQ